ncbi:M56 family metallopeptidase [uncultured Kordia sp.]|uniref:M56 family metallopeptidase n=1 Tax=uncultured Kordia sp. TaxID=507699 RepID=UPI00260D3C12|nr:M56 family metallopeptidase [uncultured Kordia sp.]
MMVYFIQVVAFQLLFLLSYDLFLKKETFFNWNRIYLIFSSLISFLLPFIKIESFQNVVPQEYIVLLPEIMLTPEKAVATIEPTWNWFLIIGITVSSLLFIYKIVQLVKLRFKGRFVKQENYTVVIIPKSTIAFSIFRYVFIGEDIHEEKLEDILSHELVHIREKHSLDLLYFELLRILCWFNPLVYIYQKRISEVHEYIADAVVVQGKNKSDYYEKLLAEVFQTQQFSFTNQFFKHSLIKKRIIMLTKEKSRQILKLKYLVLVPVLIMSLLYTSCEDTLLVDNVDKVEKLDKKALRTKIKSAIDAMSDFYESYTGEESKAKEEFEQRNKVEYNLILLLSKYNVDLDEIHDLYDQRYHDNFKRYMKIASKVVHEDANKNKIYAMGDVDKLPIYPGCETLGSQEEIKKCLTENIQKHVLKNFNMKIAEGSGLKGKQKISARFIIEKDGKVTVAEAKAPNADLSKETKRVMESLPTFIPAKKEGKPVRINYLLPITFQIQG